MTTASSDDLPVIPVDVTVTVDIQGKPHTSCTPYSVPVTAPSTLQFNLTTPGWQFTPTGAASLDSPPNPNFPDPSVTVSATQATWYDAWVSICDMTYSTYVQPAGGGEVVAVDPVIHNTNAGCDCQVCKPAALRR